MDDDFGNQLRQWRTTRHLTQGDLALKADVSKKHLSFLENGRSVPSASMVRKLCDCLDLPTESRNSLLTAAGYAESYQRPSLDDAAIQPFRRAVSWSLERHLPYPAIVIDHDGLLLDLNRTAIRLWQRRGVTKGDNIRDYLTDIDKLKADYENWQEVLQDVLAKMRPLSQTIGGNAPHDEVLARLEGQVPAEVLRPADGGPALANPRLRIEERTITYFCILSLFPANAYGLLRELSLLQYFPVDAPCRDYFLALAAEEDPA